MNARGWKREPVCGRKPLLVVSVPTPSRWWQERQNDSHDSGQNKENGEYPENF